MSLKQRKVTTPENEKVSLASSTFFTHIKLSDSGSADHSTLKSNFETQQLYQLNNNEWIVANDSNDGSQNKNSTIQSSAQVSNSGLSLYSIKKLGYQIFYSFFLPVGYPHSVSSDYGIFQICDTIQAMCSYLRGLLTTRATLIGIGVGSAQASATSATLQFVFRDLAGLVGGVLFSWKYSLRFGTEVKQWRLFADCINDLALTLELIAPLFPNLFLVFLSIASVCKAMCGGAAGATRVAIAKHFALKDNETDVSAKENIQETFVTLIGMLAGMGFTAMVGDDSIAVVWLFFFILTMIHVVANYWAVRSLQLRTLNMNRAIIIGQYWLKHNRIPTPKQVANREEIWSFLNWKSEKFSIELATPIYDISNDWLNWNLKSGLLTNKRYLIGCSNRKNRIGITYHINATDLDILIGLLHAIKTRNYAMDRTKLPNPLTTEWIRLTDSGKNAFVQQLKLSEWHIANLNSAFSLKNNRVSWVE